MYARTKSGQNVFVLIITCSILLFQIKKISQSYLQKFEVIALLFSKTCWRVLIKKLVLLICSCPKCGYFIQCDYLIQISKFCKGDKGRDER
jgi:hypothetical protein